MWDNKEACGVCECDKAGALWGERKEACGDKGFWGMGKGDVMQQSVSSIPPRQKQGHTAPGSPQYA